jgi:arabinofuranosyltransferase
MTAATAADVASAPKTGRAPLGVIVALAAIVFAAQAWAFHGVRLDDAYITFRYAQNLASGRGFVFNVGQRIMGSTSPGDVLIAACLYRMVGHDALPSVMAGLGCAAWMAQALFLFVLLRKPIGDLRAAIVAGAIGMGVAGSPHWVALETNCAAAGTLTVFVLALRSKWVWAAAACAFAGLMRADAFLVILPLGVLCLRELRLRAWRPLLVLGLLAAPWPIFATLYFGSPVPLSVSKVHHTVWHQYALHILRDLPNPEGSSLLASSGISLALVERAAFWLAAACGAWVLVRADERLWAFVVYGVLHAATYVALGPGIAFAWHLYPLSLVLFTLAFVAVGTLIVRIPTPPLRMGVAVAAVAACCIGPVDFAREFPSQLWFGARDLEYRNVAKWLAAHAEPKDIVTADEVGTLAYYADLRMNDRSGLVTRYAGDVYWRLSHKQPTHLRWLVLNQKELELGTSREYYEGRMRQVFLQPGWIICVVDVKAPRADGLLSAWEEPAR